MRYTLEREILKEACKNISDDILMELEKNLFAQKLIVDKLDSSIEFHELLFEGTNKRNIWNSIVNISTHYNRMRLLSEINMDKKLIIKQHDSYLQLTKNKSVDGIDEVVTQHIKRSIQEWITIIETNDLVKYFKNK
ncbi:MAG: FCD domain-containing protein [Romboutsia sp.]